MRGVTSSAWSENHEVHEIHEPFADFECEKLGVPGDSNLRLPNTSSSSEALS